MLKLTQQQGSSTVGLFTATAIFIGLLIYANQFAFKNSDNSFLASLINSSPVSTDTQTLTAVSVTDTDTVQPSPQGIFKTPTLIEEDRKEPVNTAESVSQVDVNPANSNDIEWSAIQPIPQDDVKPLSYVPGQWYGDQSNLSFYDAHRAGINNNHQYYTNARANGRGNGRGNLNGDGEFNFSMKFKSRARMDANSDFDSNLATYGNTYQQNGYGFNTVSHPSFGYNHYNY